jgi:uncharacterized protein (TIGR02271 family)
LLKNKSLTSGIILATIVGGIVGFIVVVNETLFLIIPGLRSILEASPFSILITTTVLGMVVGGITGAIALQYSGVRKNTDENIKIKLREEQMDITKNRVKMANVNIHKEIITDEKTITVPVTRENLVVEKEAIGNEQESKTVRIPLSEEQIEIIKHPTLLNQVSVDKKEYTETDLVEETLKKEKLTIDSKGDAKIRDKKE